MKLSIFAVIGILLLAASAYSSYWLYTHGAFGRSPVEIQVQLSEGSSLSVPFSVRERGEHYIELQHEKAGVHDIDKKLDTIAGKATLSSDGRLIASANLPVGHRSARSMVLFELPMEPHRDYRLSLDVVHLPVVLQGARSTVKVWVDPHYNLIFPQIELETVLLAVLALFCLLPGIRRQAWHLKGPFLLLLIVSGGILLLGYTGFILIRPHSFAGWQWSLVLTSFLFIWIGPVAFVLSLLFWFVASVIAYFRSLRGRNSVQRV